MPKPAHQASGLRFQQVNNYEREMAFQQQWMMKAKNAPGSGQMVTGGLPALATSMYATQKLQNYDQLMQQRAQQMYMEQQQRNPGSVANCNDKIFGKYAESIKYPTLTNLL